MKTIVKGDVESFIDGVDSLPSLPQVVQQVLEKLADSSCEFEDLSEIIQLDAAFSGKLLQISNSSYLGSLTKASTVEAAISRLGFNEVRNIATVIGMVDSFNASRGPFSIEGFWTRSLTTAATSLALSNRRGVGHSAGTSEHYLQGMALDLGMLLMGWKIEDEYTQVVTQATKENKPWYEVERDFFGFDHGDVSAALLRRWKFPAPAMDAAAWHHKPDQYQGQHSVDVKLAYLADALAEDFDTSEDQSARWAPICDQLGIPRESAMSILKEVGSFVDNASAMVGAIY